ncbi:MAG: hypothetical protein NTX25_02100 [Proteobacteria bacterium]|nr:hypothetical protein [Pseudomonadota bacterium]
MQMHIAILCLFIWIPSLISYADQLPPIGKRVYLLDRKFPSQPAEIKPIKSGGYGAGQAEMRDPIPLGKVSRKQEKETAARTIAPKRISRMVFEHASVNGRYLVPRVSFERPTLDMGRQEESIKVDYHQKIRESERELREFDW